MHVNENSEKMNFKNMWTDLGIKYVSININYVRWVKGETRHIMRPSNPIVSL